MSDLPKDMIALSDLCRELSIHYGYAGTRHALWGAVVSGVIPAWRKGREWRVRAADVPKIATMLGLKRRNGTCGALRPAPQQHQSTPSIVT